MIKRRTVHESDEFLDAINQINDKDDESEDEKTKPQIKKDEAQTPHNGDLGGWSSTKKMCFFWKRGKCKKGSSCKFDHPRECEDFIKYGLQKFRDDGKGCHPKCEKVHPFLCKFSLKTGKCGNEKCKYRHTVTTKFLNQSKEKQPKSVPQKKQTSKDTSQEHIQKTNNNTPEKSPQIIQESFLGLSLQQLRSLIRETIQQELISASTVIVRDVGN